MAALALLALTASTASAGVSSSASMTMPSTVAAGQQNLAGSFTMNNINTPPNETESNTVTVMKLAPTCGAASTVANLCPTPDPGAISVDPVATGETGTACAGATFTVSAPDGSGIVTFTKLSGPLVLGPPGSGVNSCKVNFTFDVLGIPAIDVDGAIPNTQTRANLLVTQQSNVSMLSVSNRPSLVITVVRGTPTLVTSATNGVVSQPIRDTATLTSGVPGGPTGTVTFNLYGVGDTTCTSPPVFTSAARPIVAGVATSADYNPPAVGNYRWKASYSGDANHVPLNALCNEPGELSAVEAAPRAGQSDGSVRGDFNGDGIDDLAIGAPGENLTFGDAGVVHVLYGTASGPTATGSQYWSQDAAGIADAVETGDGFGATLSAGDFNGDGRDDLAIGAPGEDLGAVADAGVVHVLPGSASGLTATGSQLWSQDSSAIADTAETGDHFGSALATGKLNGDTFAELVVSAPDDSIGAVAGAGAVHVIPGSASGLTGTASQYWTQNSSGIVDASETADGFGASLATGQIDNVLGEDLAIGVASEDVGAVVDGGVVHVLLASASGLSSTGSQYWSQDSSGIADTTEGGDRFGSALAIGKLNTDAFGELVVGAPVETYGTASGAGVVHVLPGTAAGLTGTGSQYWSQDSSGIVDTGEIGDGFGATLAIGQLNSAAGEDLAIGAPGEDGGAVVDSGVVHVLYGSASGLSSTGSQQWSQNTSGIADSVETGDRFGAALAIGKLNSDAFGDLVVGAPSETLGAITGAGVVHVIPGASAALTGTGSQYWSQDSAGIVDSAEAGDGFGTSLAG